MVDKTEEATEAPAPKPAPVFIGNGRARSKVVSLESPVEYDGREYRAITIVRLNAKEVEDMLAAINRGEPARFPIFRDENGALVPEIVLDALDDDDSLTLDEAAADFIPKRFKPKDDGAASA